MAPLSSSQSAMHWEGYIYIYISENCCIIGYSSETYWDRYRSDFFCYLGGLRNYQTLWFNLTYNITHSVLVCSSQGDKSTIIWYPKNYCNFVLRNSCMFSSRFSAVSMIYTCKNTLFWLCITNAQLTENVVSTILVKCWPVGVIYMLSLFLFIYIDIYDNNWLPVVWRQTSLVSWIWVDWRPRNFLCLPSISKARVA